MSWNTNLLLQNLNTKVNNLQTEVDELILGAGIQNPLQMDVIGNNKNITGVNLLSSTSLNTEGGTLNAVNVNNSHILYGQVDTLAINNCSLGTTLNCDNNDLENIGNINITSMSGTSSNITVSSNLDCSSNSITCGTLNYSSLNPPLPSAQGLESVLTVSDDGGGKNITNVGSINCSSISANGGTLDSLNINNCNFQYGSLDTLALNNCTLGSALNCEGENLDNVATINVSTISNTGDITVSNNLDCGTNNITCNTLNYTSLNPAISGDQGLASVLTVSNDGNNNPIQNVSNVSINYELLMTGSTNNLGVINFNTGTTSSTQISSGSNSDGSLVVQMYNNGSLVTQPVSFNVDGSVDIGNNLGVSSTNSILKVSGTGINVDGEIDGDIINLKSTSTSDRPIIYLDNNVNKYSFYNKAQTEVNAGQLNISNTVSSVNHNVLTVNSDSGNMYLGDDKGINRIWQYCGLDGSTQLKGLMYNSYNNNPLVLNYFNLVVSNTNILEVGENVPVYGWLASLDTSSFFALSDYNNSNYPTHIKYDFSKLLFQFEPTVLIEPNTNNSIVINLYLTDNPLNDYSPTNGNYLQFTFQYPQTSYIGNLTSSAVLYFQNGGNPIGANSGGTVYLMFKPLTGDFSYIVNNLSISGLVEATRPSFNTTQMINNQVVP